MRLLFVLFLVFSTYLNASEDEEYLGSSYVVDLALDPSCLQLIVATDVMNEHVGSLAKVGFCDRYTNDSQDYLRQSYSVSLGMSLYQESIYRDGFFTALSLGLERAWVDNIVNNISGDSISLIGFVGLGYQLQYKPGYKVSIGVYYKMIEALQYKDANDAGVKEALIDGDNQFVPTLLIGWRF